MLILTINCSVVCVLDIDVDEPDEKSIMTYVSSLYDVFPEVPSVEQSVRDNVSAQNWGINAVWCDNKIVLNSGISVMW